MWCGPWDAACYKLIGCPLPCCKDQTDSARWSALLRMEMELLASGPWPSKSPNRMLLFPEPPHESPCVGKVRRWNRSFPSPPQGPYRATWLSQPALKGVLKYKATMNHCSWMLIPGHGIGSQEPLSLPPLSSTSWLHCLGNNEEPSLAVSVGCFVHASAQKDSCWSLQKPAYLSET